MIPVRSKGISSEFKLAKTQKLGELAQIVKNNNFLKVIFKGGSRKISGGGGGRCSASRIVLF